MHERTDLRLAPCCALFVAVAAVTLARSAGAHPGITGYSGKPYNGTSETCTTNCHAKGANPPTLTMTVPTSVVAGSTSQVTIVVAGNRVRTSLNAAFTDGVKTVKGTNTDTPLPAQEPTELAAVDPPPSGATATYKFSFVAPNVPGAITMYVSGMAANGSGTGGDAVATTTRAITVTAVDAGMASDAGSSSGTSGTSGTSGGGTSGGGTSGGGTSGGTDGGSSSATSGMPASSSGAAVPPADDGSASGCSIGAVGRGADGSVSLSALGLSALLCLSTILRRRTPT